MHTILALAATLSFAHHGAFTLPQAYQTDIRYEHADGFNGTVRVCTWHDPHDVICIVNGFGMFFPGVPAAMYRWEDRVTRSGPCSVPVIRRTGRRSGVARGSTATRNCFTGPVVAMHLPKTLLKVS